MQSKEEQEMKYRDRPAAMKALNCVCATVTSTTFQSPPIPSRRSVRSRRAPLLRPRWAGSCPDSPPTFGHGVDGVAAGDYGGTCSSRHSNWGCYSYYYSYSTF